MRKLAIAVALATTVLASPAVARDGAWYAGIEGGFMVVTDARFDYDDSVDEVSDLLIGEHKSGIDIDAIAGMDFGMFRVEGEIAYKRAKFRNVIIEPDFSPDGNCRHRRTRPRPFRHDQCAPRLR